ncbi:NAD(P)/FAD-dependent oxidoreductase [Flavobacterium sp. SUN052]|uniref:NAD(P)/FAD-dependent oxidoreductase n=1 Tax=Flavobacterium sp. SUN052 TaxID=3002441 RepID=UPI00237EC35B|nr:NAD(P)/FAD-dependent oxidoreductase [Flavobacterium sp. SUN052]MEC4005845.1 NAD(P)/FAD-dependent oxidoreductase [Flavobacterium sp. SUN052]
MKPTITIIGAGISGLTAAVYLHRQGFTVQILEASNRAGGRIKTDLVDGFRMDRGFQVLLTEYPECKALLDYKKLNLKRFLPGATVLYDGGQFEIADPFRRPSATLATLFAPVGSIKDKINTLFLKNKLVKISIPDIFKQNEETTLSQLSKYGFSTTMINRFYKPFFAGIFLENNLSTSNRMFDFVMKMFSEGDAAIPALGMEEIPKQLVALLPDNTIKYNVKVTDIEGTSIHTKTGEIYSSDKIIIATEASGLAKNYISLSQTNSHQVTSVYFKATTAPTKKAVVVLNASENKKWVNNITVMSNISNEYAPNGQVLLCVSYNGIPTIDDSVLANNMKLELKNWYGNQVESWELLKVYKIHYALPNLNSLNDELQETSFKINEKLFICGDHLLNGSINAAMKSGRLVADLINKLS